MKIPLRGHDAERAGTMVCVLTADNGLTVMHLKDIESLADAVASQLSDPVLVDRARPDNGALGGIWQLTATHPRSIGEDEPAFMSEAVALCRRQRKPQDDVKAVDIRRRERALIDRAKALLFRQRRRAEPETCKWSRRQATSHVRRIVVFAVELIREREGSGG